MFPQERVSHCQAQEGGVCPYPLVFSMSPHLVHLAPTWLHWYYAMANTSGQHSVSGVQEVTAACPGPDVFSLPPSGHTYSYPGMMPDPMQTSFVQSTNTDCDLLLARSHCSSL